jgi:hypothetical protein
VDSSNIRNLDSVAKRGLNNKFLEFFISISIIYFSSIKFLDLINIFNTIGFCNGLKSRLAESCDSSHDSLPHIKNYFSPQPRFFSLVLLFVI